MARRLIGTGVTNSQGIATMNKDPSGTTITGYTGTGAGKLQIIAVSGNIQSTEYELIDAKLLQTGKTTGWYNTTLTLEGNRLVWVYNSSTNQYAGVRGTNLQGLIGTTFNVQVKIQSEKSVGLAVYYQDNTISYDWNNVALTRIDDTDTHELTATVPDTATNIWVRLQTTQGSLIDDDTIYIDKFLIY